MDEQTLKIMDAMAAKIEALTERIAAMEQQIEHTETLRTPVHNLADLYREIHK